MNVCRLARCSLVVTGLLLTPVQAGDNLDTKGMLNRAQNESSFGDASRLLDSVERAARRAPNSRPNDGVEQPGMPLPNWGTRSMSQQPSAARPPAPHDQKAPGREPGR